MTLPSAHCYSPSQSCQVTFQVFNEERVIELPEKPPLLGKHSTAKRVSSSGTASASNAAMTKPTPKMQDRLLRYEDVFRRIYIIREITQIKRRGPNIGDTVGYTMESYATPLLPKYDKSLAEATKNEDVDILRAILDIDKSLDESYLFVAARNWLPLPVFELLIAAGEDINRPDQYNRAPLHITCEWSAEISALLIAKGANPKAVTIDLSTPLHHAGSPEVARLLISLGADVDGINQSRRTPLIEASARGLENVARVLLKRGANVEATDEEGRTPLSYSQIEGMTRLLLEFGASPNSLDNDNMTPLHHSWLGGCVHALIDHGADVNTRSADGWTPLHMAECLSVAKALLDNGADVNASDVSGRTPLHASVRSKYFKDDIARLLLKNGAEVNARDLEGRTPIHWARRSCRDVLIEYGADVQAVDNSVQTKDLFVRNYNWATFRETSDRMDDESTHSANSTQRHSPATKKLPRAGGQPCKRNHIYA